MFILRKITIITAFYPPHLGDESRFSYYIARELTSLGVQVCIITTGTQKEVRKKKIDGIDIIFLPAKHRYKRFVMLNHKGYKQIFAILEKLKPDGVILNDYYRQLSYIGAKAANLLSLHTILINHMTGYVHDEIKNKLFSWAYEKYEKKMIENIRKRSIEFAGTSHAQNEWLRHLKINSKFMISDAIDIEDIPAPGMRRKMNIPSDAIVYCADLNMIFTCYDDVIDAFKMANKWSGPKIYLVLSGEHQDIKKHEDDNIIYTDILPGEDILSLLDAANVYITTRKNAQSLSRDILEAGMCGCCVICINQGGQSQIIKNDSMGFVLQSSDVEKLSILIQKLRNHKELRKKTGEKLKNEVLLKYNWNQSALSLIDAVCLLNDKRRRR